MSILRYPDLALLVPARPCVSLTPSNRRFIDVELTNAWTVGAAGLAAPQIGIHRRAVRVRLDGRLVTLFDPVFVASETARQVVADERCLSVVDACGRLVPFAISRADAGALTATTVDGEPVAFDLPGFEARLVQHEIDHLDGVTIVSRAAEQESTLPRQVRRANGRALGRLPQIVEVA